MRCKHAHNQLHVLLLGASPSEDCPGTPALLFAVRLLLRDPGRLSHESLCESGLCSSAIPGRISMFQVKQTRLGIKSSGESRKLTG